MSKRLDKDIALTSGVIETYRKIEDAVSKTVKISHSEVLRLVVDDLTAKYVHNINANNHEWINAFEKVLRCYLDNEEIEKIKAQAAPAGAKE